MNNCTYLVQQDHGIHWPFWSFVNNEVDDHRFSYSADDSKDTEKTNQNYGKESMPLNNMN